MKKLLLVVLLISTISALSMAEENITLDTAMRKATLTFPDLPATPKSIPPNPVIVNGEKYWVVEFDVSELKQVWVPVRYSDGALVLRDDELLREMYTLHLTLQRISVQKSSEDYPTKKKLPLNGLLGEVKNQQDFIETYSSLLPGVLQEKASNLLHSTKELRSSIETTISAITELEALEERLLGTPVSQEDISTWKKSFSNLLTLMAQISNKGDVYETTRKDFIKSANDFLSDPTVNDTGTKENVRDFIQGVGIPSIGSLPGLKTTANDWKMTFLEVQLSNESLGEKVNQLLSHYKELQSEETINELQEAVHEKLSAMADAPAVINRLYSCAGDLDSVTLQNLHTLNKSYYKAVNAYNEGTNYYKKLEYEKARESYLNAREYANDAEEKLSKLSNVHCPTKPPSGKTIGEILGEFINSPTGWITILLVIVLIALIWWNKKKEEGEYDEEPGYYGIHY